MTRIKDFGDVSKLAKADQYFGEVCYRPITFPGICGDLQVNRS